MKNRRVKASVLTSTDSGRELMMMYPGLGFLEPIRAGKFAAYWVDMLRSEPPPPPKPWTSVYKRALNAIKDP